MPRFYLTTPIYYVNDVPHLGTAYTTIAVDALRRYHLLRGHETRMLTGTDEHGQKMEREALARGESPAEFARKMSDRFEAAWPKLEIKPDDFVRTTQERHERQAQALWRTVEKTGDIYEGTYEGWYCYGCEGYKTEKDLLPGNICPLHNRPVEWLKEETCFFKLSEYAPKLLDYYRAHPEFIEPESRRNEVVSFVESGLKDLSVSRTSVTWGIPVPGRPKHVMYVWFDALANYWTVLQGDEASKKFWNDATVVHVVGKDILRFHAVYWPAFLMSAGLALPKTIFAHGFLTYGGQKMSKSLRNAVDPIGIAHGFGEAIHGTDDSGADVVRYQLLRAIAFGQDGDFDLGAMIERYNADLGKNVGNLLSRTLSLCVTLAGGRVPPVGTLDDVVDRRDFIDHVRTRLHYAAERWDAIEPHRALEVAMDIASQANTYIDRRAPWADAKNGRVERAHTTLAVLLEVLRAISVILWPVIPSKADEMRRQLGLLPIDPHVGRDLWPLELEFDRSGQELRRGSSLFPTIDDEGAQALLAKLTPRVDGEPTSGATTSATPLAGSTSAAPAIAPGSSTSTSSSPSASPAAITYDQFSGVDLRVGLVRSCERVPKKDKLLKLAVDVGEAEPRTIVAGLALSFQPGDLVGRRVVVVANLAPREFGKGLVSHGMLLATGPSEKLVLATVDGDVAPGARLK